jgi:hypothetical protein
VHDRHDGMAIGGHQLDPGLLGYLPNSVSIGMPRLECSAWFALRSDVRCPAGRAASD